MTLKHIDFFDSPVMREMERNALKSGEFTISAAARTIKESKNNINKEFIPTEDVFSDLINLAIGLREKGMFKQAEELEEKITNYKIAEIHLYRAIDEDGEDVLNFAHKDGDITVSPASKDYGVVETLQSTQKKIQDIVNKKPTGKLSSAQALVAVAEALDLKKKDLNKVAQITATTIEEKVAQDQETVNNIFVNLNKYIDSLIALINPKAIGISYSRLLQYSQIQRLFNELTGGKYSWYLNKLNLAKEAGIDISNPQTIVNSIQQKLTIPDQALYTQTVVELMQNVIGVTQATGKETPEHIAGYIVPWFNEVNNAVNTVNKALDAEANKYINILNQVKESTTEGVKIDPTTGSYDKAIEKLNEINAIINKNFNIKNNRKLALLVSFHMQAGANVNLRAITEELLKFVHEGSRKISQLVPGRSSRPISNKIREALNMYSQAANAWSRTLRALQAGEIDEAKAGKEDIINANLSNSMQLAKMLQNAIRSNFTAGELLRQFNKEVDGVSVRTEDDILNHAQNWNNFANSKAVTASIKNKTIKLSKSIIKEAISGIPIDPHSGQAGLKPTVKQPTRTTKSPAKSVSKLEDFPEKDIVSMMQQTMRSLANALLNLNTDLKINNKIIPLDKIKQIAPKMGSTGYGTETPLDGKWGTNTQASLKQIEAFFKSLGINIKLDTGVYWIKGQPHYPANSSHKDVIQKAEANIDQIAQNMKVIGLGTPEGYSEKPKQLELDNLLDKLPFFAIRTNPKTLEHKGEYKPEESDANKPVYVENLVSLNEFFSFLVDNNIYPIGREGGAAKGYTIGEWNKIFNWFRDRSSFVHSLSVKNEEPDSYLKKAYMDLINALYKSYANIRNSLINSNKDKIASGEIVAENLLVHPEFLRRGRGGAFEQIEQMARQMSNLAPVDEGTDWNRSSTTRTRQDALTNPFSLDKPLNILALVRAWSQYANIKYLSAYNAWASDVGVRYDTFIRGNIEDLASMMTRSTSNGNSLPASKQIQNFRNLLIYFSRDMKEILRAFLEGDGPQMAGRMPEEINADVQAAFEKWFAAIRRVARRADVYQGRRRTYRG